MKKNKSILLTKAKIFKNILKKWRKSVDNMYFLVYNALENNK